MITERQRAAIEAVRTQLNELQQLLRSVRSEDGVRAGRERLSRWKERTAQILQSAVHPEEAARFRAKQPNHLGSSRLTNFARDLEVYREFLGVLDSELNSHPQYILERPSEAVQKSSLRTPQESKNQAVFIVHGHDELNLLRLKEIIRNRWSLPVRVLSGEPGKGRTLIEKFEEEATLAAFAFVLLTPDDLVTTSNGGYAQARPNVVFELGWFYGRLGRKNVCLLFRAGTKIHSDLDGVSRIEFDKTIIEKLDEIERELIAAGLLK